MKVTAIICAYNAAGTIERAVRSCRNEVDELLIIDDGSNDQLEAAIHSAKQDLNDTLKLTVRLVQHPKNLGLGAARQTGLEHCQTDFALWLDADDELLPGRVTNAITFLEQGADFVFDASELVEEAEPNVQVRHIPDFLISEQKLALQFARNFIPALAVPVFRVSCAKRIGYRSLRNAEDYNFLLRAILAGANIGFSDFVGYREHASRTSLSSDHTAQLQGKVSALRDIDYNELDRYLSSALTSSSTQTPHSISEIDADLVRAYFLAQSEQWALLLLLCDKLREKLEEKRQKTGTIPSDELKAFEWHKDFFRGVAHYRLGNAQAAVQDFERAVSLCANAESYNNLGVALSTNSTATTQAKAAFETANRLNPNYRDAQNNMAQFGNAKALTASPLRQASQTGQRASQTSILLSEVALTVPIRTNKKDS